jgi:biotin carboxyl carrier protein
MSALPEPTPTRSVVASPKRRMSTRNRVIFLATGWLIVSMPFLFWWNTWFGRKLSDQQLTEYLQDEKKPRHIQQALVQISERMSQHDAAVSRFYPEVLRLSTYPVEEVRNTDAWVMGQDTSAPAFHDALLKMLNDPSAMVRGNAALSLVRFGDASGRPQIVALLQPARVVAPRSGKVAEISAVGTSLHQGGLVAKLQADGQITEVRSPISGRLRQLFAQSGQTVTAGAEIAAVDPGTEQVWEGLRALYLAGQPEDLPAITPYERELPEIPDQVRQQAALTEQAIRQRAK